jgi:hypothetical protein
VLLVWSELILRSLFVPQLNCGTNSGLPGVNAEIWWEVFWRGKADFASIPGYDDSVQNKCSKIKWVRAKSPEISPIFAGIFAARPASPNRSPPCGGWLKKTKNCLFAGCSRQTGNFSILLGIFIA